MHAKISRFTIEPAPVAFSNDIRSAGRPHLEDERMNPGFEEIMNIRGRGMPADGEVTIDGHDPVYSARFKIGETTANILGGVGVAVTDIHEIKTGRRQKVAIDVRHAA